jgi:hypothetical protein
MKQNNREVVFWSTQEDGDSLCESDMDQVIADHLDEYASSEWGETLEVYGYAPVECRIKDGTSLDYLIEFLDQDYGDPNGYGTEITQAMKDAEKMFYDIVLREYKPGTYEVVEKRTINIAQWCKDNNYEVSE